jgi:hypothetical protein
VFGHNFFGFLSLAVSIAGYAPYIVSTINGKTRPHAFSWIVWTMAVALVWVAQVSRDAGPGAWVTACAVIACVFISGLSFRYGEKGITRSDEVVFGVTLAAIPLWALTRDPLASVALMAVINVLGFVPTFRKTYKDPFSENMLFYISVVLKFMLGLLALDHYSFVTTLFPINSIVVNSLFIAMLVWRRREISGLGPFHDRGTPKKPVWKLPRLHLAERLHGIKRFCRSHLAAQRSGLPSPPMWSARRSAMTIVDAGLAMPKRKTEIPPPLPKPSTPRWGGRAFFSALQTERS